MSGLLGQQFSPEHKVYEESRFRKEVALYNAVAINTDALEFSPSFYRDGILFVSSRRKNGPIDKTIGERFFEIYFSRLDPNGFPTKPQSFSVQINSQFHEGPVTLSPNGREIFFTRNDLSGKTLAGDSTGTKVGMRIYSAVRGPVDWEQVKPLDLGAEGYNCIHPTLSSDGNVLYFASDMPGGQGGYDLYRVQRDGEGAWSEPENLGPEINSPGKEGFPYIHKDNVLFYASDGHPGEGGLDLFIAPLDSAGLVQNLGLPFNSPQDDLGLIVNAEGTRGYFTSNRAGGMGKDDIYLFEASSPIDELVPQPKAMAQAGQELEWPILVEDVTNGRPLSRTSLRLLDWTMQEGEGVGRFFHVELLPKTDGSGEMSLQMTPKENVDMGPPDGVTEGNGRADLKGISGKEYLLTANRDGYFPYEQRVRFPNPPLPGQNVKPLRIALEPASCIDLNGVASAVGLSKPIEGALVRIINECNGQEQIVRSNYAGKFTACLEIGCDYTLVSQRQGFRNGYSSVTTAYLRGQRSISAKLEMAPIEGIPTAFGNDIREGSVIVLEDIYYDFNKFTIREDQASDLEALAQLMKAYPEMEVELGAHTDARGSRDYNLSLSLKRAESAKAFLVRRGIHPERIKAYGYGETRLRNNCTDGVPCSDAEHQYNRRTEVKVLKMGEVKPELKGQAVDASGRRR